MTTPYRRYPVQTVAAAVLMAGVLLAGEAGLPRATGAESVRTGKQSDGPPVPGCSDSGEGSGLYVGDPRAVAPQPADLGIEWDPYTEALDGLPYHEYSATYRLGVPSRGGVLLSFGLYVLPSVANAIYAYCQYTAGPRAKDLLIGDGAFITPHTDAFLPWSSFEPECDGDVGGVSAGGQARARNVWLSVGVWHDAGHVMCQMSYVEVVMQAFAYRVASALNGPIAPSA